MPDVDLLVIGGGAAGFFGALAAAEVQPGLRVLVLEQGAQPLAKVKISGGGRCNVTTSITDPAALVAWYPRGSRELRGPFTRFGPADTMAWFEARGVRLKTEPDGRVFPVSDESQTVIDCLLAEARRLGVRWQVKAGARALEKIDDGFAVEASGGQRWMARQVLLAPGGGSAAAYRLAAGLGHTIVPPVPSLFTFNIKDAWLEGLAGVSVPAAHLRLAAHGERFEAAGPLLVTHWGLSGPAVLRLSAWGARALAAEGHTGDLRVNWLGEAKTEDVLAQLLAEKKAHPRQQVAKHNPLGGLPARLWARLVLLSGIPETQTWADTSNKTLRTLAEELTAGEYAVQGKGVFKEEFVTAGGVSLKEVDFRTMESRVFPGLFLAGEILDIDGLTGGFNFQSAWTTGWLAGRAAGAALA